MPLVYFIYPETAGRTLEDIDSYVLHRPWPCPVANLVLHNRYFRTHSNIFVHRDKLATSPKRPQEYIERERSEVRRHSSVDGHAADLAAIRHRNGSATGGDPANPKSGDNYASGKGPRDDEETRSYKESV